jgi:Uncharacterised protein family (UPF0236)
MINKEDLLKLVDSKWDELAKLESRHDSFYNYEDEFDKLWRSLGQQAFQSLISDLQDSNNIKKSKRTKRKVQTSYDYIYIDRNHKYAIQVNSFKISPFLTGKMLYLSQHTNYEEAAALFHSFYRIDCNDSKLFRMVSHYGRKAESIMKQEPTTDNVDDDTLIYAQCDGSMILTRPEDGSTKGQWKEVKVCRVFLSKYKLTSCKRSWIEKSFYAAHLGKHSDFKEKAEVLIDPFEKFHERLVFISDGAPWIYRWQLENYPKSTSILDFFHVIEHLGEFAKVVFTNDQECDTWIQKQASELKKSNLQGVLDEINKIAKGKSNQAKGKAKKLIAYYKKNESRMDYKSYLEKGLQIGSGAIEAAHRTVIQKRLKQSGQRWTEEGAQNIINLRTAFMSGRWNQVIALINKQAA